MKIGKISTAQLVSTKTGSIGLTALGLYFILVTLLISGAVDYPNLILGLTFIGCAILYASSSPQVLSGLLVGFIGVVNLLAISNVFPIDSAWMITALCAAGVFFFEYTRFGKASKQAKYAIIIPMISLFFMFLLAIIGWNPVLYVDYATQSMKFINYVALMFLTGILSFKFLGWNIPKKNQGMWITVLALLCVITSFIGVYQGTLSW